MRIADVTVRNQMLGDCADASLIRKYHLTSLLFQFLTDNNLRV
jgi:hypothetical protein